MIAGGRVDPVKSIFFDTSGFYAFLNLDDRFHAEAKRLFLKSEAGGLALVTSSYVLHESWALIQARQARERRLSLTDCVSFEVMLAEGCRE